ncbi:MAG: DUF805 domain-containing protein [bacterium]|nr:DUF805 domain-containing protein [bacterium]
MNLFYGRLNRRNFFVGTLFSIIVPFAVLFPIALVTGDSFDSHLIPQSITIIISILALLFEFSLFARRYHDIGKSGWRALFNLIPLVMPIMMILLLLIPGETKDSKYGKQPSKNVKFPNDLLNL